MKEKEKAELSLLRGLALQLGKDRYPLTDKAWDMLIEWEDVFYYSSPREFNEEPNHG